MLSKEDENIINLSWLLYQKKINELAFESNIISKIMFTYAKERLENEIDKAEKVCYI